MRRLTIESKSFESAHGLYSALSGFYPTLSDREDGFFVSVSVEGTAKRLLEVLDAIEASVSDRGDESARVELDGRS